MKATCQCNHLYKIIIFNNCAYEKFPDGTVKCIQDEVPLELPQGGWACTRLGKATAKALIDNAPEK